MTGTMFASSTRTDPQGRQPHELHAHKIRDGLAVVLGRRCNVGPAGLRVPIRMRVGSRTAPTHEMGGRSTVGMSALLEQQRLAALAPADYAHIALTYITAFYFNRADTQPLSDLLTRYASYAPDILDHLQFVLVDDASPVRPAIPDVNLNLLMLRIHPDIPWNQPGARNLGVVRARSDKVLMTDLDHLFPEDTLRHIVRMRDPGRNFYKMRRFKADGAEVHAHPNTFVLSRARFLKFYGYDEEFCGHYGYDDAMFWRWQRNHGTRFLYLPRCCRTECRTIDHDRSYHTLPRDLSFNAGIAARKREEWRRFGPNAGHSRRFLEFSWDIVLDRRRGTRLPEPPRRPLWTSTWFWRFLRPWG